MDNAQGWFPTWLVLDRDGTLIQDEHYLHQVAQVQLLPQTIKGLKCFQERGCRFVVVTNQSGVGRGYFDVQQVSAVHAHLQSIFQSEGINVRDYFFCPHKPSDGCACRKPGVALYQKAAARHKIVATDCLVVGDKASDIALGQRVSANTAAGIVVGEVGTVAASPEQLINGLRPREAAKMMSSAALQEQSKAWRRAGKRVVFTNGCFDLFHAGHLALLHQCAALGDILVIGINSDSSVERLKGPDRPWVPEGERAALLGALNCVDAVVIFSEDTPLRLVEQVSPDVLVKGQDYRIDDVVGREWVETHGGRVELVPLLPDRSTSRLQQRIQQREEAAAVLKRGGALASQVMPPAENK